MSMHPPLNTPFYGGLAVSPVVGGPGGFPVGLAGRPYLIDVRQYRRTFVDAFRSAQDTSEVTGEQTLNPEGVWVRFGTDWRYGAGQKRFDGVDADRRRFHHSYGVDVWTQGQVSLLPDTEVLYTETTKTIVKLLVGPSDQLVVVLEDDVDVLTAGSPTGITSFTPTAIYDATADTNTVWLATDDGIWSFPFATLIAAKYTPTDSDSWDSILIANGRLVGGKDNTLYEITSAGVTVTAIDSHTSPAFRWTVLAEHPEFIYGGGRLGSRFEMFRFGVDASTGSIDKKVPSLFLPGGEQVNAMLHYVGKVILATTRGVRMAEVDGNGNLNYGALIDEPGEVRALYGTGDYVWFSWDNVQPSHSGLGRLAPARFADPDALVPTYASDLTYASANDVLAVAEHQGRTVFAVDGVGVVEAAANTYREDGWLETGLIDFDIPYTVQPLSLQVRTLPLPADCLVRGTFTTSDGQTTQVLGAHQTEGETESERWLFGSLRTDGYELHFDLEGPGTDTPTMTIWINQASPQPQRIEQILLPLVLTTTVQVHEQAPLDGQEPIEEYRYLRDLVKAGTVVLYQEGPASYKVKVKTIEMHPHRWVEPNFNFFEHILLVQLQVVDDA